VNVAAPVRNPDAFINSFQAQEGSGLACGVTKAATIQCLYAVSEMFVDAGPGDGIYGLFANTQFLDGGSAPHWELLSGGPGLWSQVTAIAPTYDGSTIFVGNANGQIFELDLGTTFNGASAVSPPKALAFGPLPPTCAGPPCAVTGLYAFNQGLAYATFGPNVMLWGGLEWLAVDGASPNNLPNNRDFLSIVAADPINLYVASSAGVFDTSNGGGSWSAASSGLPALIAGFPGFQQQPNALGSHDYLQLVTQPSSTGNGQNAGELFLASYGRSLWKTLPELPVPAAFRQLSSITIEIWTGNDNLEHFSELQGTFTDGTTNVAAFCLHASSQNAASPGGVCSNGSGIDWPNGADVKQTFYFNQPVTLDGDLLTISLTQHYPIPYTSDNWDIQGIEVTGVDTVGNSVALLTLTQELPYKSGVNNCIARLRDVPNPGWVTYDLSVNDPTGIEDAHPNDQLVITFGATPPGRCPQ
jgi:hypothetical protein